MKRQFAEKCAVQWECDDGAFPASLCFCVCCFCLWRAWRHYPGTFFPLRVLCCFLCSLCRDARCALFLHAFGCDPCVSRSMIYEGELHSVFGEGLLPPFLILWHPLWGCLFTTTLAGINGSSLPPVNVIVLGPNTAFLGAGINGS